MYSVYKMLNNMNMNRQLKKLRKRMTFDDLEYGNGEFYFRLGTHMITESEIEDESIQKILSHMRRSVNHLGITELLIES